MNASLRFLSLPLCALLLASASSPCAAQEGGKGREVIGGILKAILEAQQQREGGTPATPTPLQAQVDLNAFRTVFTSFRQELDVLAFAIPKSGNQTVRALSPQIAQLQNRAKFSDAYLSRETKPEIFTEHFTALEQEWRAISTRLSQIQSVDRPIITSATKMDGFTIDLWRHLGRAPQVVPGAPGTPAPGGGFAHGADATVLLGLLNREIENLYDQISLRHILTLPPQQTERLFGHAVRFWDASDALEGLVVNGARQDLLVASHRTLQQEWSPLNTLIRAEKTLRLDASCDRVGSYVAELGELVSGTGKYRGQGASPLPATDPALLQLSALSTRLEVLAGDLEEIIRRDGEHFRNDSLRTSLSTQSSQFLTRSQNFRRFVMRPTLDRTGKVDATLLRQSWQPAAASWQQLTVTIDQLASQVRRADRYSSEIFRSQDDVAAVVAEIQALVK